MRNGNTFIGLLRDLRQEVKTFIRQEVQLAKTEVSEKITAIGKDTVNILIGGFAVYAGLIILLGGLGALLAFALQHLGLDSLLAAFVGLGIIGLLAIAVGGVTLLQGVHALKKESLVPHKTLHTLHHLNRTQPVPQLKLEQKGENKPTSKEIEASVMATENEMAETIEELTGRVTFKHARMKAEEDIRLHPYRWGLLALGSGLCGSFLLKRKPVATKN